MMTELLQAKKTDTVLDVGTGYQATILAVFAREVYTIEIVPASVRQLRFLSLTQWTSAEVHCVAIRA
jgi:protein-L-isoaspartate O-methyltransferase